MEEGKTNASVHVPIVQVRIVRVLVPQGRVVVRLADRPFHAESLRPTVVTSHPPDDARHEADIGASSVIA